MEGFLEKKGGSHSGLGLLPVGRRNWKRRWFVLEGAVLTYYEDFDPATNKPIGAAKGCVDLRGCQAKLCPHKPRKGTPRVHTFSIEKPKGERLLMEATGPMAEKLKFAWLRALEDAIAKSMSKEGRRASLRAAQDVDAPEHYERLGLEKRGDLTDKDIRKAYRRVAVARHPDRGGDPESFIALHEAYEVIINARAARREALRYGECVFEGRIKKEPKGGFGLTVCERKEGGVAIKRVVFWSCATTCVERPEGIERELPSSELSFRAGDRIVGVCAEIKFHGAVVLNRRVDLHAIDATPARRRGGANFPPLHGRVIAENAPDAVVDFHTGSHQIHGRLRLPSSSLLLLLGELHGQTVRRDVRHAVAERRDHHGQRERPPC